MRRHLHLRLAASQIAALVLFIAGMAAIAAFYKWRTMAYFEPLLDYVASFRIAVPPAIVAVLSYVIAFLTGVAVHDVPKSALSFVRNRFLQSYYWMIPFIAASLLGIGWIAYVTTYEAPPHYATFVAKLLGGESDDHVEARKALQEIERINPLVAVKFSSVIDVFDERRKQSSGERSAARANVLIRTLEANIDEAWQNHPLRRHGLAEAYVLAAQAAGSGRNRVLDVAERQYDQAIELYRSVSESQSPLATDLLRASALNNTGNIHLYRGQLNDAVSVYRTLVDNETLRNTSSWGNLIAVLVYLGRASDAIEEGLAAKAWAEEQGRAFSEPYQYASILENTGHAYWVSGKYEEAHPFFETASAFRDDPLNRANLSLSFALLGDREQAAAYMRTVGESARPDNAMGLARSPEANVCDFIIWAAILSPDRTPDRAANLSVFLREPLNESSLTDVTPAAAKHMADRALAQLPTLQEPCSSLGGIRGFRELLLQ